MKKHGLILLITLIMLKSTSPLFAIGGNLGGPTQDGSADWPYLIEDFNDFQAFCNDPNYWAENIHTQLTCNLDLDPNLPGKDVYTVAPIAPDGPDNGGWKSYEISLNAVLDNDDLNLLIQIGEDSTTPDSYRASFQFTGTIFNGIFDGKGYSISNLTIRTIDENNCHVGLFGCSGGLIKNLKIEDCNIISCSDSFYIGGLCGVNYGTINNSHVTGAIIGRDSSHYIGGICGVNYSGIISNCHVFGIVTGENISDAIGGLCGVNSYYSLISNCYVICSVFGGDYIGGLCGGNESEATISNCYAAGMIAGGETHDFLGGLCGCYMGGTTTNCFWDIETSGTTVGYNLRPHFTSTITNVVGKTTAEMKTASTFTDAGWDFIDTWNIGENQTYPFLRKYSAGDVNHDSTVNFADLAIIANNWLGGVE